jgi:hypothetical protein
MNWSSELNHRKVISLLQSLKINLRILDYIKIILAMGKNNYSTIREQDPYSQTETSALTLFMKTIMQKTINSI